MGVARTRHAPAISTTSGDQARARMTAGRWTPTQRPNAQPALRRFGGMDPVHLRLRTSSCRLRPCSNRSPGAHAVLAVVLVGAAIAAVVFEGAIIVAATLAMF